MSVSDNWLYCLQRILGCNASYDAACKRFLSENTMSVIGCVADNGHKFYVCGSIKR